MTVQKIIHHPNDILLEKSVFVRKIDNNIHNLITDLIDTMEAYNAAGIAAIQIGRTESIFIIDAKIANTFTPKVFMNPKIIKYSDNTSIMTV